MTGVSHDAVSNSERATKAPKIEFPVMRASFRIIGIPSEMEAIDLDSALAFSRAVGEYILLSPGGRTAVFCFQSPDSQQDA
jgi:hypothetical protein